MLAPSHHPIPSPQALEARPGESRAVIRSISSASAAHPMSASSGSSSNLRTEMSKGTSPGLSFGDAARVPTPKHTHTHTHTHTRGRPGRHPTSTLWGMNQSSRYQPTPSSPTTASIKHLTTVKTPRPGTGPSSRVSLPACRRPTRQTTRFLCPCLF